MQVIAQQGETLDSLCYRVNRLEPGTVEAALEVNPGLADIGPILPQGLTVILPESVKPIRHLLQLWD